MAKNSTRRIRLIGLVLMVTAGCASGGTPAIRFRPDSGNMSLRAELFVADVSRSVDFYTHILGFKVERNSDDYVSIRRGEVVLGISPIANLDPDHYFRPEVGTIRNGLGVEFVLEVDDVIALEREVRAAGYPLIKPIAKQPWGLTDFRVADPDGYFLRVTSHR